LYDLLLKWVLILLFRACGSYLVHAASVIRGGDSILFVGEQGVGKSTICAMAVQAGHATLNDDQHLLRRMRDGRVEALGLPSRFSLHPAIAERVPQLGFLRHGAESCGSPKHSFAVDSVFPGSLRQGSVPTHLVLLSPPSPCGNSTVRALSKPRSLCRLIRSSEMVLLEVGAPESHLHVLRQLVQQCKCVEASLGRDVYQEPSRVLDMCVQRGA
jgi:hypothetical protein